MFWHKIFDDEQSRGYGYVVLRCLKYWQCSCYYTLKNTFILYCWFTLPINATTHNNGKSANLAPAVTVELPSYMYWLFPLLTRRSAGK